MASMVRARAGTDVTGTAVGMRALVQANVLKCPELLVRGTDLQDKVTLERLEKKGKRFESEWDVCFIGLYAGVLFYYDNLNDLPNGVLPLAGCTVKAVDRIFKNQDNGEAVAEECGPCFKVTTSAHRVVLFRCPTDISRFAWIQQINRVCREIETRGSSLSSTDSSENMENGELDQRRLSLDESNLRRQRRRSIQKDDSVPLDPEISQMLRDAMALVKKQKVEILELKRALQEALEKKKVETIVSIPVKADEEVRIETSTADCTVETSQKMSDTVAAEATVSVEVVANVETKEEDDGVSVDIDVDVDVEGDVDVEDENDDDEYSLDDVKAPSSTENYDLHQDEFGSARATTVDLFNTEYLQRQAMELAEIARNLQLSFRNDGYSSGKQINSANSFTPTEMLDQISITGSNSNYSTSGLSDSGERRSDDGSDAGSERLSEFEAADAKFLESNGIFDSIQQAMQEFMSPAHSPKGDMIINDDIIAELRHSDSPRKRPSEGRASRILRSQSSSADEGYSNRVSPFSDAILQTKTARAHSTQLDEPDINPHRLSARPKDLSVLIVEDSMAVVSSILQTASRDEKSSLLLPLLRVFGSKSCLSSLIQWAIDTEVASIVNVATLFRSDDYASRLVSTYSKAVGFRYIKDTLIEPVKELYKLKLADVDLTPAKHAEVGGDDSVRQNATNLMSTCQMILDAILASKNHIPASYFHICSHLNAKVISRFDGSVEGVAAEDPESLTRSVIGGFLFLRLVCPALTTPHLHDLAEKEPSSETRRVLVLVTKLLFKTATSVPFGEREPHFRILNPFIEKNSAAIQELFVELSAEPFTVIEECFTHDSLNLFCGVSADQQEQDLAVIRKVSMKNFEEVEKKLKPSQTLEHLRTALFPPHQGQNDKVVHKSKRLRFLSSFRSKSRKHSEV